MEDDDGMGCAVNCRMTAPRLLAIDTATETLAVAVLAQGRTWCAQEPGAAAASQRVLPLAFELLQAAGIAVGELDAVAFGRGPGAFTGLRTACSVAQGLALGLGRPLLALDSLALVAEDARVRHGANALWVAMDARMNEVYAGAYRWDQGRWQAERAPALYALPAWQAACAAWPLPAVAGSALDAFGARLECGAAQRLGGMPDRAAALARLAEAAWRQGQAIDAAEGLPLYLRDKVALTTAERARARALEAGTAVAR
jgi:tRNA threonylcarbamoyladenosine biosynthesis protein TsaB